MHERNGSTIALPDSESQDVLSGILRRGARKLLAEAIEAEVTEWIEAHATVRDATGRRQVVRNGYLPERSITTGLGPVEIRQPRVHDRRHGADVERFRSKILPPYLRKARSVEELIPWLYLKGISTGDFQEALSALVGPDCPGLSAATVTRLKGVWEAEYEAWNKRDLVGKQYVYVWADGVHFNVRLEDDRTCILVLMGATAEGTKELIAVVDGYRESEQSWTTLLLDVKARGLSNEPKLAVGDGALGFWKALAKVFPTTREQRCTVHKTANVLDKLPKRLQPQAKAKLNDIWQADTRAHAGEAFDLFLATYEGKYHARDAVKQFESTYGAKFPKAVAKISDDVEQLLAFYDFPAEHWIHLRTTNPIESTFATVRLRHRRTKGNGSRRACLTMVFKLMESAAQHWRLLNGTKLLPDVIAGVVFNDGVKAQAAAA
jgi:transposase-like protein